MCRRPGPPAEAAPANPILIKGLRKTNWSHRDRTPRADRLGRIAADPAAGPCAHPAAARLGPSRTTRDPHAAGPTAPRRLPSRAHTARMHYCVSRRRRDRPDCQRVAARPADASGRSDRRRWTRRLRPRVPSYASAADRSVRQLSGRSRRSRSRQRLIIPSHLLRGQHPAQESCSGNFA